MGNSETAIELLSYLLVCITATLCIMYCYKLKGLDVINNEKFYTDYIVRCLV